MAKNDRKNTASPAGIRSAVALIRLDITKKTRTDITFIAIPHRGRRGGVGLFMGGPFRAIQWVAPRAGHRKPETACPCPLTSV
ncbi:hypothetical protein GCM10011452_14770 [Gemmobacter lanyuensis]|uniref:Uncharacterized protein n=1 Tax=Gemmobacter lanyuensis TaxID=1054497 RepID=A0A918IRQ4_9RHOB|nr:hypothetical protein GCM10011452_14770 [Gemmobacter lanyuensis]